MPPPGASAGFHASGHQTTACQGCHVTSLSNELRLVWQTYTGATTAAPHGKVTADGCIGCHEKEPAQWRLVEQTAGHREHRDAKNVDCLSCHGPSTHAGTPPAPQRVCLGCHKEERLHKATTVGAETCLSCHSYAVNKNVEAPTTVACARCHSSEIHLAASSAGVVRPLKEVGEHGLHSGVACQLCHNAHGIKLKVPDGQPSCAACHKVETVQVATSDRTGPEEHRKCEGCHKPHLPRKSAQQRCIDCHEKKAKGLIGDQTASTRAPTALKHESCTSCHVPHSWKADVAGCTSCHKKEANLVATRSPPEHKACVDCHDVHGPPPTGAVCVKCHAGTKGRHVALAPERHKDCTSCHNPHAPGAEEARASCGSCHGKEQTELVRDAPGAHGKNSCFTCHKPHDNPMPPAGICGSCHADKAQLVASAGPPRHRACVSCHEPHQARIAEAAAVCNKCHTGLFDASSKPPQHMAHQGECKTCHAFHGSPAVAQVRCLGCHREVAARLNPPNPMHAECGTCHRPHAAASTASARCATCHTNAAAVAAMWPAASAHAQACVGCHQPHAARETKPCSGCHAAEVASASGGKHQCKQCHEPHAAPPGTGAAWWSRCNSCHAKEVEGAKARGPTHSKCKSCHEPHKFAVPSCSSCHKDMPGRGLHAAPTHAATCASCHDAHVEARPTREQCLKCHTDRRAHEPSAPSCFTCHSFR